MVTIIISGKGNAKYAGADGIADAFDFNTTGATRVSVADNWISQSSPGVLDLALLGSLHADTVAVQMLGGLLDARNVTFGGGWSATRDTLAIRDTGLDSTIFGSRLRDRIEVTGGEDVVQGGAGSDTLVLSFGAKSESFTMPLADRIVGSGDTSVQFTSIERLDATFGGGDDNVRGLAGNDNLRGEGGADVLRGGAGHDLLRGGTGVDTLIGGTGNDTYYVDSGLDRFKELSGEGLDTVYSLASLDLLGSHVENAVLRGSGDLWVGGGQTGNSITGNAGDNYISGRGGRDTIILGADTGADTVGFGGASDSTGTGRDLVRGFDAAAEDRIGLVVTGISELALLSRSGGLLRSDSFDADIAAALDMVLGAGGSMQAVLWDPSGGNLNMPGHRYLVVDMDNSGDYAAGLDLVIQFAGIQGTLGLSDFLLVA